MSRKLFSLLAIAMVFNTLLVSCGRAQHPAPADETQDTSVRPADGMTMVYVPGGEFRMGQIWSLQDRVHTVEVDSFWLDQTEVTNAHYRRCVEAGACRAPTTCNWGEPTYRDASKTDHPVICVTWQAASDYCRWAGGRLPTEAEWEYAARGPQATTYPWGDDFDGSRLNSCDANCPHEDQRSTGYDDGQALTAPAGSYPSGTSWCGALDLAGNVWEWVADWHGPYPWTRQTNPTGPESGSERLIRGGSWYENNEYGFLRADNRHPFDPHDYNHLIGFRCVVPAGELVRSFPRGAGWCGALGVAGNVWEWVAHRGGLSYRCVAPRLVEGGYADAQIWQVDDRLFARSSGACGSLRNIRNPGAMRNSRVPGVSTRGDVPRMPQGHMPGMP